jgi:glycosyltransferase involved in cell wall biosynthesis
MNRSSGCADRLSVLLVASYFHPATVYGGPVSSNLSLVRGLSRSGVRVRVATTDANGRERISLPRVRDDSGVEIHTLRRLGRRLPGFGTFFFAPGMVPTLARLIQESDLVQIQGTWVFPNLVASRLARLYRKPYIISPKGTLEPWALEQKNLKKRIYLALVENSTLKHARCIHYTTPLERCLSEQRFPGLHSVVVPNAVDETDLPPAENVAAERRYLGVDAETPVVLFLGRLHVVKGLDLFIEAAAEASRRVPKARFAIVGPGDPEERAIVSSLIDQHQLTGKVSLHDPVDRQRARALLAAADVFVLPSIQENFGMSAAEAMVCGTPVVTSRAVGVADDIATTESGLVVERTAVGFAKAIAELLSNAEERGRLAGNARRSALSLYSPKSVSERMTKIYRDVIEDWRACG